MTTDFSDISADFSLRYHLNYLKISQKARQQGLNYFLQGYIHKIKINKDNQLLIVNAECYRPGDGTLIFSDTYVSLKNAKNTLLYGRHVEP